MPWRYQPVVVEGEEPAYVALIEVYFDNDDTLTVWSAIDDWTVPQWPSGDDIGELRSDLARMLADAYKWVPVRYADLKRGMTFKRTGVDVEAMIAAMTKAAP